MQQGRELEDAVEERVEALGQPFTTRTRFSGRGNLDAPADFAIPSGSEALIAVAVKGFDSTGSKLSDATREIEQMVEVKSVRLRRGRRPRVVASPERPSQDPRAVVQV